VTAPPYGTSVAASHRPRPTASGGTLPPSMQTQVSTKAGRRTADHRVACPLPAHETGLWRVTFNTFGGNPLACAIGKAVLEAIDVSGLQAELLVATSLGVYWRLRTSRRRRTRRRRNKPMSRLT
jgi:uncharacterized iron-regulated membrane protein